jgi:hypothetical protein
MSEAGEERRRRFPDGAFGRELARVEYGGVLPSVLIATLSKGKEANQEWGRALVHAIERFEISTGRERDKRLRRVDDPEGQRLLMFALQLFGLMERGEGARRKELRVDGPAGFWGRTEPPDTRKQRKRLRPAKLRASGPLAFDRKTGTFRLTMLDSRPYRTREKRARRYCSKEQCGGLAARHGVTTRTIGNWARVLREAGFLGCRQPPRDAEDAVSSRRQGDYPYGVWRVLRALPSKMMQRLQLFWGEFTAQEDEVGRSSSVPQHARRSSRPERHRRGRAPPRRRRSSELEREKRRGELAAREAVRGDT